MATCLETIGYATLAFITTTDLYVGKTLSYCGRGTTANKPTPAKKLLCTDLYGVTSVTCSANSNIICTQWPNKDNNACPGDYGGPLYNFLGETATVIGVAAYPPDLRANAHCTDGHKVEFTQLGTYDAWISATILAG